MKSGSCGRTQPRWDGSSMKLGCGRRCILGPFPDLEILSACWTEDDDRRKGWRWLPATGKTLSTLERWIEGLYQRQCPRVSHESGKWTTISLAVSAAEDRFGRVTICTALEKLSTTVSIVSLPSDGGNAVMKSRAMWGHGRSGTGSEWRSPAGGRWVVLPCAQMVQAPHIHGCHPWWMATKNGAEAGARCERLQVNRQNVKCVPIAELEDEQREAKTDDP